MSHEMYAINVDTILKTKELPAIVKQAALLFRQRGVFTISEWLSDLTVFDLTMLMAMFEATDADGPTVFALVTLMEVLTAAEGLQSDEKTCVERLNRLSVLLTLESLHRKGLIEFFKEHATLGDDYDHHKLAARKE